jgi:hypothetical protein
VFTVSKNSKDVYYIINFNPEGWVIVSADYAAYPIIGSSDTGSYSPENHPPAFDAWMENVKEEIYRAITEKLPPLEEATLAWQRLNTPTGTFSSKIASDFATQAIPGILVGPLIGSLWGQGGSPYLLPWIPGYDAYCPAEKQRKCAWIVWPWWQECWWEWQVASTGCVATAMGQIMRYWEWPPVGEDYNEYKVLDQPQRTYTPGPDTADYKSYGYGLRKADFSKSYYDWDNMPLIGLYGNDEIARLMRDIGISINMNYNRTGDLESSSSVADGSAPYFDMKPSANHAFKTYFRYNPSAGYKGKSNYTDTEWSNMLKVELDAGRPIMYQGLKGPGQSGHAFICDGYNALLGTFHFNWGWYGALDGWYWLNALTIWPIFDFTYGQGGIFNLKPDYPTDVYVDDDYVKGASGGHSWGYNAFNNIQDGIDMVTLAGGGTVWVNPGSYSNITMKQGIMVVGVGGPEVTVIGGNYQGRAVTADDVGEATLKGFTITGGKADTGAAMYIRNSWVGVENCVFTDNLATNGGGGMYNVNAWPTVTNCIFWGNSSHGSGGGMYNDNSSPRVINCIFLQNNASDDGGGMYNVNSSPTVTNCTFWGNSAADLGDGMLNSGASSPEITNSIFWDDSSDEIANLGGASPTITYCDVQGGYSGMGNINDAPMLKDPGNGDVHLKPSSLCIDTGNNSAASIPSNDFEGDVRCIDGDIDGTATVDMGADEYAPTVPVAGDDSYSISEDETLNEANPGVLGNDSHPDGNPLEAVKNSDPTHGTLTLNGDGSFIYEPDLNFNGIDSFTYHATDSAINSNIATVTIEVEPVADPPEAIEDFYEVDEDQVLTVAGPGVLDNDVDPDGDTIEAIKDSDPSDGILTLNTNGAFSYEPDGNFNGTDFFTYHATDGSDNSSIVTVTITIFPVNDPPEANAGGPYTSTEGSPVEFTGSGSDIDGDLIQYRWDFDDNGSWDTDWSDSGTASHMWGDDWIGTVRLEVSDGELTDSATAEVTIENVAPILDASPNQTVDVGEMVNLFASFSDPGWLDTHAADIDYGDSSSEVGTITEPNGSSGSITGNHIYTWPGTYEVMIEVSDDDDGIGSSMFVVDVLPVPEIMVETLGDELDAMELPEGLDNSLIKSLNTTTKVLEDSNPKNDVAAINILEAFINKLEAQQGKKIPSDIVDELILKAQEIITAIIGGI